MSDIRSGGRPRDESRTPGATARPLPPRPSLVRSIAAGDDVANPTTLARPPAVKKPRPDPGPIRIALGLTGIATATALITAFLGPAVGADAGGGAGPTDPAAVALVAEPSQAIRHVIRYVQLKPGQTAPPQAVVKQAPAPKPRIVVVTTKQSGK
jgi:hypothetical protein